MTTLTKRSRPGADAAARGSGRDATRVVVGVIGALAGLAGIEHGIGEMLQGPVRPDGLLIASWPDSLAMEILSGEPALTVIPNLLVTGMFAVAVGLAVVVWSIWFATRPRGGLGLIGLSVLLLLVGGGLAPPVIGVVVGAVATRTGRAPQRPPGRLGRTLAPAWPWFLGGALVGYLGLMPGMVLASLRWEVSDALVVGLAALAFGGLGFALAAARAHDRLHALET